jgi:hypothetical protein
MAKSGGADILFGLAQVHSGAATKVVLHNGEQEIDRELAPAADALRVALMMLGPSTPWATGDRRRAQGDAAPGLGRCAVALGSDAGTVVSAKGQGARRRAGRP